MFQERLKKLFKNYESPVPQVVYEVSKLEQRYISMRNPRGIHKEIDEIITRIARQELNKSTVEEE